MQRYIIDILNKYYKSSSLSQFSLTIFYIAIFSNTKIPRVITAWKFYQLSLGYSGIDLELFLETISVS